MTLTQIIAELRGLSSPNVRDSQERFGINTSTSTGVSAPNLKALASSSIGQSSRAIEDMIILSDDE